MACRQKILIFGIFKACISKIKKWEFSKTSVEIRQMAETGVLSPQTPNTLTEN